MVLGGGGHMVFGGEVIWFWGEERGIQWSPTKYEGAGFL